jgi:deferrochelatase/peroxidase EfeB
MSKVYVWSTLSCDTAYASYRQGGGDLQILSRSVLIKGGANMATKHLNTPKGVCTRITLEELEVCRNDPIFGRHEKRGFIKVETLDAKVDEAVSDMVGRDDSSPLNPDDFNADDAANKPKPATSHPAQARNKSAPKPPSTTAKS